MVDRVTTIAPVMSSLRVLCAIVLSAGCFIQFCNCLPVPSIRHGSYDGSKSQSVITNYRPSLANQQPRILDASSPEKPPELLPSIHLNENKPELHYTDFQARNDPSQASKHRSTENKHRSSIFSVIHPALHAAFASEKTFEKSLPPTEPLAKVEYQSSPLRGTEARDRNAIGLSSVANAPRATFDLHEHIASAPFHTPAQSEQGGPDTFKENKVHDPVLRDHENTYASVIANYLSPSPAHAYVPIAAMSPPLHFDDSSTRLKNPENSTDTEPTLAVDNSHDQNSSRKAALDAVESAWRRMVSSVRHTLDSVLSPPTPSPDPFEQQVNHIAKASGSYMYTQQDIDNLVSDIMYQIQLHQGEVRAHQDMLKNSGHWDPHDFSTRERDLGVTPPTLVMRTSVLVSPDVLADAVTTSTKKLLLSKASQMSWSVASRLLVDIHSRLADMFEPVNTFSPQPTFTSFANSSSNFSTNGSTTSTKNTNTNVSTTNDHAGRGHTPQRAKTVSLAAASRITSPILPEWAKIDPADFADLSGRDSYVGHTSSVSSVRTRMP